MKQSRKPFWGIVIAVLVVVAALWIEVIMVGIFLKAKQVENWPSTNGTILKSELTSQFHGSTTYEARIEYEYRVGDRQHKSNQVRTRGSANEHRSDIAPLVEKYPVGQEVRVYYNPADASDAYLEAGVDFVNYIIIVSPLFFAFVGCTYLVATFREKRSG